MKFSFRLESLLSWKRSLEERSQMKLAQKREQLRRQKEEIQELIRRRLENDQRLRERAEAGLPEWEYLIYKQFSEESYRDLMQKESYKKETEKEIENERENLKGLIKERKILEKLKERRFKNYAENLEKLEQKSLDQAAIEKHRRSHQVNGHSVNSP